MPPPEAWPAAAGSCSACRPTDAAGVEAVATGALLGAYAFHRFRGRSADQSKPGVRSFVVATGPTADAKAARAGLAHARAVADAVTLARDLVNTPPNI